PPAPPASGKASGDMMPFPATLWSNVQYAMLTDPWLRIPPPEPPGDRGGLPSPLKPAEFSARVQPMSVNVPELKMPPLEPAWPPAAAQGPPGQLTTAPYPPLPAWFP